MHDIFFRWLTAAGLWLGLAASAAAQAQSVPADPVPAPDLQYRSAFAAYRGFGDQAVGSWSGVNDTVGKIGGWRTYAKESAPGAPPAGASAPPPVPAATGTDKKDAASGGAHGSHAGPGARP